jgi:hypothetical protein
MNRAHAHIDAHRNAWELRGARQAQVFSLLRTAGIEGDSVERIAKLLAVSFITALTIASEVDHGDWVRDVHFLTRSSAHATLSARERE